MKNYDLLEIKFKETLDLAWERERGCLSVWKSMQKRERLCICRRESLVSSFMFYCIAVWIESVGICSEHAL